MLSIVYSPIDIIINTFNSIILIFVAIISLGFIISFHELGHFLIAKLFGIYIPSFSIGFGPKLIEKKIGETNFLISAIPLGGYVEIAGSPEIGQGEQKYALDKSPRSFENKPYWQKMAVISGGIIFNLIFGYIALIYLVYTGSPFIAILTPKEPAIISNIILDENVKNIGLKYKDRILKINDKDIHSIEDANNIIKKLDNNQISITIERDKEIINLNSQIKENKDNVYSLNIVWYLEPKNIKESFILSYKIIANVILTTIKTLLKIEKKEKIQFTGPLRIIKDLTVFIKIGFKALIFFLAIISINLALFNIFPFPIFDGGQALFTTIEAIIRKPISLNIKEKIYYTTWLLVIIFTIYITYKDIVSIADIKYLISILILVLTTITIIYSNEIKGLIKNLSK